MALNLKITASAFKDGPELVNEVPNFPENLQEAVAKYGEDAVYAGFVKTFVIAVQAKIRAEYKAPNTGTRVKRGSALSQIQAARMKAASEAAAQTVE